MLSRLARNIDYWRQIRGYSQAQLSQRAGLAITAVNDIYRSPDRSPRLQTVEQLASALDITLTQLLEGAEAASDSTRTASLAGAGMSRDAISIVNIENFTSAERAQAETYPPEMRERLRIAVATAFEAVLFGVLPGERLAVVPARDYAGRVVVVTSEAGAATLRYCVPPWLISFQPGAAPTHEFMERPSLTILGAISAARIAPQGAEARFPVPEV